MNAHSRGDSHQNLKKESLNQQKIFISKEISISISLLTKEKNVIKAETLNALHYVEANYSDSSATKQSLLYKKIFPDSSVAQSFTPPASKMAYIVKYGLAEYFKKQVQLDLEGVHYTFKFDETTSQVKK